LLKEGAVAKVMVNTMVFPVLVDKMAWFVSMCIIRLESLAQAVFSTRGIVRECGTPPNWGIFFLNYAWVLSKSRDFLDKYT
jgi:hypothetical protein